MPTNPCSPTTAADRPLMLNQRGARPVDVDRAALASVGLGDAMATVLGTPARGRPTGTWHRAPVDPPTRRLAEDLGVSRGLVVEVYAQLVAEGHLVAIHGSGTSVAPRPSPPPPPGPVVATRRFVADNPGHSDPALFPRQEWGRALTAALRELPDDQLLASRIPQVPAHHALDLSPDAVPGNRDTATPRTRPGFRHSRRPTAHRCVRPRTGDPGCRPPRWMSMAATRNVETC